MAGKGSGMQRSVSPVMAIIACVAAVAAIGGVWWAIQSKKTAEVMEKGDRAANLQKAIKDPATLEKLKAMSKGSGAAQPE